MAMQFEQKFGTEAGSLKEIAAAVVGALRAGAPPTAVPSVGKKRNGDLVAIYFTWNPDDLPDDPRELAAAVEGAVGDDD